MQYRASLRNRCKFTQIHKRQWRKTFRTHSPNTPHHTHTHNPTPTDTHTHTQTHTQNNNNKQTNKQEKGKKEKTAWFLYRSDIIISWSFSMWQCKKYLQLKKSFYWWFVSKALFKWTDTLKQMIYYYFFITLSKKEKLKTTNYTTDGGDAT